MAADTGNQWDSFYVARHDMINVLQALKFQYDLAMEAARNVNRWMSGIMSSALAAWTGRCLQPGSWMS